VDRVKRGDLVVVAVSGIMVDKVTTVLRTRIGRTIGHLEDDTLLRMSRALALWVGIAA
jgi:mRNA interferase MazF